MQFSMDLWPPVRTLSVMSYFTHSLLVNSNAEVIAIYQDLTELQSNVDCSLPFKV